MKSKTQKLLKPCSVCKCDRNNRTLEDWKLSRCWLCLWRLRTRFPQDLQQQFIEDCNREEKACEQTFLNRWMTREIAKATRLEQRRVKRLTAEVQRLKAAVRNKRNATTGGVPRN